MSIKSTTDDNPTTVGTNQNKATRCTSHPGKRATNRTTHAHETIPQPLARIRTRQQGARPSPATSNEPATLVNAPRAHETTRFGSLDSVRRGFVAPPRPKQRQARRSRAYRSKGVRVRTFCRSAWSKEQRLGSGDRPKAPETDAAVGRAGDAMLCAAVIGGCARVSFGDGSAVVRGFARERKRRRKGRG
jgi:hypothetical protein